ncbi:protein MAIN-LIKE 2-like [Gossypium raimondii]|uniref:protein MAIN-LIKE 2-like n=1 Tax=Gossypium raimondii TaxID=29730 RepID=UPI00063AD4E0|nr:protein MAIN-LIKE 2-like [Gossypium raimondii]
MDGSVVPNKEDLCDALLGKVPNKFQGGRIDMKWLETNFKDLPLNVPNDGKEQYTRAFILRLIGDILMSDKTRNMVDIMWLLHLADFKGCGRLIWESTVLAMLYRELCRVTELDKMSISACLLLLQSWA